MLPLQQRPQRTDILKSGERQETIAKQTRTPGSQHWRHQIIRFFIDVRATHRIAWRPEYCTCMVTQLPFAFISVRRNAVGIRDQQTHEFIYRRTPKRGSIT